MKNKFLIITGCAILTALPANAAKNCCAKCPYNVNAAACTENCCDSPGTSTSEPDANHIITITTQTETVTCATSSTGTNLVMCRTTGSCKCEKGYYGSPAYNLLNGGCTGTCTRCPASGGVYGTTASSGATSITECYIPTGTSLSDTTGTYQFTGNCYYSN